MHFLQGIFDKGDEAIPVPGSIAILEAERLGKLTHEGIAAAGPLEQRTVPLTPRQYEEMRRQYRARMAEAR